MSIPAAIERIRLEIRRHVAAVEPYRAVVTSVGSGLVGIKRIGASTADTRTYARVIGFSLAADDVVLVANLNGEPVVIGKIQTSAPQTLTIGDSQADTLYLQSHIKAVSNPVTIANTPVGTYPGAGTTPGSVTVTGNDTIIMVTFTTGTTPGAGAIFKATFGTARATSTYAVWVLPMNNGASQIQPYVSRTTTDVTVIAKVAPPASTSIQFAILILGVS